MGAKYILALDQGTTSSRAILFDRRGGIAALAQKEFRQVFPRPGWVEHDPREIWGSQLGVAQEAIARAGISPVDIAAIGITNQRETTLVWEKESGNPLGNAIVWQCRRSAEICDGIKADGAMASYIQENTGLVVDAYFSATKLKWILDNTPGTRAKAKKGELLFGTVDTWLIWNLTGGRAHVTDYSNASRTMLFNIRTLQWDEKILDFLDIPRAMLPQVRPSSEVYTYTAADYFGGAKIPIAGAAGDQQAALFGQACFHEGMAKITYGTGCFMLMNTGAHPILSQQGLLTTIAWGEGGQVEYALEGSIFVAGAAVQWLRDELGLVREAADTEKIALQVPDTNGVYVVPAFVGLGAPYWDMYARGAILGLTRGAKAAHIIRATLESIAYQARDVLTAMEKDAELTLNGLKVDGGAAANNFLMQFQADLLNVAVERPLITETTALGAAYLAGLAVGYWRDKEEIARNWQAERRFTPDLAPAKRDQLYRGWQKAVSRARQWEDG